MLSRRQRKSKKIKRKEKRRISKNLYYMVTVSFKFAPDLDRDVRWDTASTTFKSVLKRPDEAVIQQKATSAAFDYARDRVTPQYELFVEDVTVVSSVQVQRQEYINYNDLPLYRSILTYPKLGLSALPDQDGFCAYNLTKKLFPSLDLPKKAGTTITDLYEICKAHKRTFYACDLMLGHILVHQEPQLKTDRHTDRNKGAVIVVVCNDHLYEVKDPSIRSAIVRSKKKAVMGDIIEQRDTSIKTERTHICVSSPPSPSELIQYKDTNFYVDTHRLNITYMRYL